MTLYHLEYLYLVGTLFSEKINECWHFHEKFCFFLIAPSRLFRLFMAYTNHPRFLPLVSEMIPLGHSPHLFYYQASPEYLLYSSTILGLGRFGVKEGDSLCPWEVGSAYLCESAQHHILPNCNRTGFACIWLACNGTYQSHVFIKLIWTFTDDICHLEFPLNKIDCEQITKGYCFRTSGIWKWPICKELDVKVFSLKWDHYLSYT